jgi:hypothetical protein
MSSVKNILIIIFTIIISSSFQYEAQSQNNEYDIVIYGGTSAGLLQQFKVPEWVNQCL